MSKEKKKTVKKLLIGFYINHIINLKNGDYKCDKVCTDLYSFINKNSDTVLYDDTNERAGAKLAKADLIGLPYQIIVGPNGIKDQFFDFKNRKKVIILIFIKNEDDTFS